MGSFVENNNTTSLVVSNMVVGSAVQTGDVLYTNNPSNSIINVLPTAMNGGVVPFTNAYRESSLVPYSSSVSNVSSAQKSISIASLVGGGWVVTYVDVGSNFPRYRLYNSAGAFQSDGVIESYNLTASNHITSVCALSGGGFSVAYGTAGNPLKLASYTVNTTGTWSATILSGFPVTVAATTQSSITNTGIGTNSVAIAYNTTVTAVSLAIYSSTGSVTLAPTSIAANFVDTGSLNGLSSCTLSTGNFTVAYRSNTLMRIRVFNTSGTLVNSNDITVSASSAVTSLDMVSTPTGMTIGYTFTAGSIAIVGGFYLSNSLSPNSFTTPVTGSVSASIISPVSVSYNSVTNGAVFAAFGEYTRTDQYGNQIGYSNYLNNCQTTSQIVVSAVGNDIAVAYYETGGGSGNLYFGLQTQTINTINSYCKLPSSSYYGVQYYENVNININSEYGFGSTGLTHGTSAILPSGDVVSVFANSKTASAYGGQLYSVVTLTITGVDGTLKLIRMIGGVNFTSLASTAKCCVLTNGNIAVLLHNPTATTGGFGLAILDQYGNTVSPMVSIVSAGIGLSAMTAMPNGNFAIIVNSATVTSTLYIYNNVGTNIYASDITTTLAPSVSSPTSTVAIAALNDSSLVFVYSGASAQGYVRINSVGTTIKSDATIPFTNGAVRAVSVCATPDGGFIIVTGYNGSSLGLTRYSATNVPTTSTVSTADTSTVNVLTTLINPINNHIVATAITTNSTLTYVFGYSGSYNSQINRIYANAWSCVGVVIAPNGNIITHSSVSNGYTLATAQINVPVSLVGIAGSSGNANDTVPVIISGNGTTRLDWGLNNPSFNYLNTINAGIKGSIIGNTAILDRSQNSLA